MAIDTCVFIYLLEKNVEYRSVVLPMFRKIHEGALPAVTSSLTLLETLVVPYRAGDQRLANRYESVLSASRGLDCIPVNRGILRAAAMLRAKARIRTPDAIQLATALQRGCTSFVTNDRELPPLGRLRIVQLKQMLSKRGG